MKKLLIIPALLLAFVVVLPLFVACSDVVSPIETPEADAGGLSQEGVYNGMVRVRYIVCGDAEAVAMAFNSQWSANDTIPCAVLPIMMDVMLPSGTESYLKAYKFDSSDVVTVLIIANGFVNAMDTARPGDAMAEARVKVWDVDNGSWNNDRLESNKYL